LTPEIIAAANEASHRFALNEILRSSGSLPAAARALNSLAFRDRQPIRLLAFRTAERQCDVF
jgi:hypothetical protein